jgi:hypothetical protein
VNEPAASEPQQRELRRESNEWQRKRQVSTCISRDDGPPGPVLHKSNIQPINQLTYMTYIQTLRGLTSPTLHTGPFSRPKMKDNIGIGPFVGGGVLFSSAAFRAAGRKGRFVRRTSVF